MSESGIYRTINHKVLTSTLSFYHLLSDKYEIMNFVFGDTIFLS